MRSRRRWLVEAIVGLAMIPLTAIPIYLYVTRTDDGYLMYLRGRYAIAAPGTPSLDDEQLRRALEARERLRDLRGVPVLVYHGLGKIGADTKDSRYVLSRERFAEHMHTLRAAGYEPITTAQLALYMNVDPAADDIPETEVLGLPERPVLVTFDDGRADAMIQADPILEDTGMRATMFVIGRAVAEGGFYYESAESLRERAASGRWELANHTHALHDFVETGPGAERSALVTLNRGETLMSYRRRVAGDVARSQEQLEELTGREAVAFAYPFGDWGEGMPEVAEVLGDVLRDRFTVAFDQDEQETWRPVLPGDDLLHLHRLQVESWTGEQLLARLEQGAAQADGVYEERGLGYRFSELELAVARARTQCAPAEDVPVRRREVGESLVALTFSDGPSADTAGVLDVLERYGANATFFVSPDQVAGHERLLRRMLVEGNEIGSAVAVAPGLEGISGSELESELERAAGEIEDATGDEPCLTRPSPEVDASRLASVASGRGTSTVLWSVDSGDHDGASAAEIAARTVALPRSGDIVVLHDGGALDRAATLEALPALLEGLLARGYRFVTVSELMAWKREPVDICGLGGYCPGPGEDRQLARTGPILVNAVTQTPSRAAPPAAPAAASGAAERPKKGGGDRGSGGGGGGAGNDGTGTAPSPVSPPAPQPPGATDVGGAGTTTSPPPPREEAPPPPGDQRPPDPSPGQGGTPPGAGAGQSGGGGQGGGTGTGQGAASPPPGQGGTPPGQGGTPPGQGGTPPGQGGTPPGQAQGQGGGQGKGKGGTTTG